jgi:hypothetical protein
VRVGDVIVPRQGQLARVIKFVWAHGKSRAQGHIAIDTVELSTRKRSSARMKTDEVVEYVELTGKTVQVWQAVTENIGCPAETSSIQGQPSATTQLYPSPEGQTLTCEGR